MQKFPEASSNKWVAAVWGMTLILLGICAGLSLLEAGLHLWPGLLPPAVRQALAIYNDIHQTSDVNRPFMPDSELIYVPRPNVDLEIHDGLDLQYTVQTGSFGQPAVGFRDVDPITSTYAVAMGDSFTWGTYVEAGQSWPKQLQTETSAPVLNFGVLGYGPIQYRLVTEKYALPLKPRVILWGVFSGNDFVNSADYEAWVQGGKHGTGLTQPETGWRDVLSRHLRVYELVKFALHTGIYYQRLTSPQVITVPARDGPVWTFYPDILERQADGRQPEVARGWSLTQQALRQTEAEAQATGAQLVLVIIPPKELIYWGLFQAQLANPGGYDLAEPIRTLIDFCQKQKLRCLNLAPAFSDQAKNGQELYFRQDTHWNPAGHHLAAKLIADYLYRQHLQP